MPVDRKKYPPNWPAVSRAIRDRAGDRCECHGECGRGHDSFCICVGREGPCACELSRCVEMGGLPAIAFRGNVVLTVAHLSHDTTDNRPENLRAMCQRCHLAYDQDHHQANAAATRHERKAAGDLFE
jgi:hypothetical protein